MSENESGLEISCAPEESAARLALCQSCPYFKLKDDGLTVCETSGCLINLMITFKFKLCPVGKWL